MINKHITPQNIFSIKSSPVEIKIKGSDGEYYNAIWCDTTIRGEKEGPYKSRRTSDDMPILSKHDITVLQSCGGSAIYR